ncbi:MAG TPA: hypothetical protein VK639_07905 [Terriglobales bacterium]|nr:hypothetical protein [Terriglobales bacterium]
MSPLRNGKVRNLKSVPRTRAQAPPNNIESGDVPIGITPPNGKLTDDEERAKDARTGTIG